MSSKEFFVLGVWFCFYKRKLDELEGRMTPKDADFNDKTVNFLRL